MMESLDIIAGAIEVIKATFSTVWDFIIDPIGTVKCIADPVFLTLVAALILLKALGFKNTEKYIKLSFIIYIIILVF